jgi:hypothetical protein
MRRSRSTRSSPARACTITCCAAGADGKKPDFFGPSQAPRTSSRPTSRSTATGDDHRRLHAQRRDQAGDDPGRFIGAGNSFGPTPKKTVGASKAPRRSSARTGASARFVPMVSGLKVS